MTPPTQNHGPGPDPEILLRETITRIAVEPDHTITIEQLHLQISAQSVDWLHLVGEQFARNFPNGLPPEMQQTLERHVHELEHHLRELRTIALSSGYEDPEEAKKASGARNFQDLSEHAQHVLAERILDILKNASPEEAKALADAIRGNMSLSPEERARIADLVQNREKLTSAECQNSVVSAFLSGDEAVFLLAELLNRGGHVHQYLAESFKLATAGVRAAKEGIAQTVTALIVAEAERTLAAYNYRDRSSRQRTLALEASDGQDFGRKGAHDEDSRGRRHGSPFDDEYDSMREYLKALEQALHELGEARRKEKVEAQATLEAEEAERREKFQKILARIISDILRHDPMVLNSPEFIAARQTHYVEMPPMRHVEWRLRDLARVRENSKPFPDFPQGLTLEDDARENAMRARRRTAA